jgi:Cdc6-like AAA superfamily ATPase
VYSHGTPISSSAVELAETEAKKSNKNIEEARVTIGLIHQAVRDMFATSAVASVRDASFHEKMFLTSMIKTLLGTGVHEATLGEVYRLFFHYYFIFYLTLLLTPSTTYYRPVA